MLPVVFPLLGETRVRDTYHASRGGGTRVHQGVDLPLLARAYDRDALYPVRASVPGTIVRISREGPRGQPNEGNAVFLRDADGWTHLFAHLRDAPPESMVGQTVRAGYVIGIASNSGNARNTGPHLHYHIVDSHGRRVNPTQRLAQLHASLEAQRVATGARRRALQERDRQRAMTTEVRESRRERVMQRGLSVRGVGDDDLATGRPGARARVVPTGRAGTPDEARAPSVRDESQAAIEQARMAYRGARGLVEREAVEATRPSMWDGLAGLVDRERAEQTIAVRQMLTPVIFGHLESASVAAADAERGQAVRWIDAFEQLLAAHRLVGTMTSTFDSLRENPLFQPMLDAIELADEAIEGSMRSGEALRATIQETHDDIAEAAPGIALGLVLAVAGAGYLWWKAAKSR